jgi:hypothetical protein
MEHDVASKYEHLKGKIPEQPTARDTALTEALTLIESQTIADLTANYNALNEKSDELAAAVKVVNLQMDALEIVIRRRLDAQNADAVRISGYTWSEKFEPYPVCEDPAAIVAYFESHGMEDQLTLRNSELAARLKNFVKEEALAGGLQMTTKTVPDPTTGVDSEIVEVRSSIPGVRVFLKGTLSRVKSSKKE